MEPLALWLVGAAVVIRFAAITDVRSWESQAGAVIGTAAALMMLSLSASIPTRLMPAAAAISVLAEIDHAMRGRTPRMQVVGVEGDPMNWYRPRLRQACTHLEREARRLDRTMHGGQHPVGSVLRASAQHLQHFLSSETSLAGRPPADIQTVVSGLVMVLAGPRRGEPYRQLAIAVDAFDGHGQPRFVRRQSSIGPALARAGRSVRALLDIATLLIPLVAIVLAVFGRSDLSEILR